MYLYKNLLGTVTVEEMRGPSRDEFGPCLINFNDQAIFKCGGGHKTVELYHPKKDSWTRTNDLNEERY